MIDTERSKSSQSHEQKHKAVNGYEQTSRTFIDAQKVGGLERNARRCQDIKGSGLSFK